MLNYLLLAKKIQNDSHFFEQHHAGCVCASLLNCGRASATGPTSCWQTSSLWTWNDVYRRISAEPANTGGWFSSANNELLAHLLCDRIPRRHTSRMTTRKKKNGWKEKSILVNHITRFALIQSPRQEHLFFFSIYLGATFFVCILMLDAVHFETMRFQGATLCEWFLAQIALVWPDAGVCSCVPFQVECIIESLAAERAQIAFDIRMTFHVSVEQPLQCKRFVTLSALEFIFIISISRFGCCLFIFVIAKTMTLNGINGQWVFETMSTIYEFKLHFWRQSQLK